MLVDEMKLRIKTFAEKMVDLYFPCNSVINKLGGATAKLYINQHIDELNDILNVFANKEGEIDENVVMKVYEDALFDDNGELRVNLKEMIQDKIGQNMAAVLPERVILLKKEDLHRIFS